MFWFWKEEEKKEHGPYRPGREKEEPECVVSPDGKHCWHYVREDSESYRPPAIAGGDRTEGTVWEYEVYRCCWCGREKKKVKRVRAREGPPSWPNR